MTRARKPLYLRTYHPGQSKKETRSFEIGKLLLLLNEGVLLGLPPHDKLNAVIQKEVADDLSPILNRSGSEADCVRRLLQKITAMKTPTVWILERPAIEPHYREHFLRLDNQKFFVRMTTDWTKVKTRKERARAIYFGIILKLLTECTISEIHRCKQCKRVFWSEDRRRTDFCPPPSECSREHFREGATERKKLSRERVRKETEEHQARELHSKVKRSAKSVRHEDKEFLLWVRERFPNSDLGETKDFDALNPATQKRYSEVAKMLP